MAENPNTVVETLSSGDVRVKTILHWQHKNGDAHCLARITLPDSSRTPVAVISELRTNPMGRSMTLDFANVATRFIYFLNPIAELDNSKVIWVAHYGNFSDYEYYPAPDEFVRINLKWDGKDYIDDITFHKSINTDQERERLSLNKLEYTPKVLEQLDWESSKCFKW